MTSPIATRARRPRAAMLSLRGHENCSFLEVLAMTAYHHFVSLQTADGAMPTYVAAPEGREPRPGVLVIQGMHGIAAFELQVAERLAENGFVAVVPDMFPRGPA